MLGRGATIFLGLTAALSIWAIVLYFWDINLTQLSRSEFEAISWGGAAAPIGWPIRSRLVTLNYLTELPPLVVLAATPSTAAMTRIAVDAIVPMTKSLWLET